MKTKQKEAAIARILKKIENLDTRRREKIQLIINHRFDINNTISLSSSEDTKDEANQCEQKSIYTPKHKHLPQSGASSKDTA